MLLTVPETLYKQRQDLKMFLAAMVYFPSKVLSQPKLKCNKYTKNPWVWISLYRPSWQTAKLGHRRDFWESSDAYPGGSRQQTPRTFLCPVLEFFLDKTLRFKFLRVQKGRGKEILGFPKKEWLLRTVIDGGLARIARVQGASSSSLMPSRLQETTFIDWVNIHQE